MITSKNLATPAQVRLVYAVLKVSKNTFQKNSKNVCCMHVFTVFNYLETLVSTFRDFYFWKILNFLLGHFSAKVSKRHNFAEIVLEAIIVSFLPSKNYYGMSVSPRLNLKLFLVILY
ncbi:uncharacterized protein CELE_C50C3.12 [Caenorhabditis elegans]|uniref:Uncharacterized protein n=1 Tax=Caenorhabditis elegans TaxID=6239 RepID=Q8MNU3_CAEEL|nr:Uncharacterized protein CELE_C50C3.12 [Caenorhabditis elegans]CCD66127.1 Uncharacterized protein CELE_C50C3.12 [Caenorhabditis elegans]|eukprot:NP_741247.1 Uncharacterized protein CELE_C50C3.12 [Caenorhabditis elegans]